MKLFVLVLLAGACFAAVIKECPPPKPPQLDTCACDPQQQKFKPAPTMLAKFESPLHDSGCAPKFKFTQPAYKSASGVL